MQRHKNEWLIANAKKIEGVQRQLLEHAYAGSYGGSIDLTAVNNLLGGAVIEITKLQNEIEELKKPKEEPKPADGKAGKKGKN
jgi:hypothetical protein